MHRMGGNFGAGAGCAGCGETLVTLVYPSAPHVTLNLQIITWTTSSDMNEKSKNFQTWEIFHCLDMRWAWVNKSHQSLTASSTSCSRTKVAPHAMHFALASSYVYVGLWLPYKGSLSVYTFQFPAPAQSEKMSVPSYSQFWFFIAQFCARGQPPSAGLENKMENHTLAY